MAYSLAVAEENGSGGKVVTAPTCGSCAVVPSTLRYILEANPFLKQDDIIDALATAGLIGNVMKTNASISGAAVGCQGEIGTACAMAAGAVVQLLGGTPSQVNREEVTLKKERKQRTQWIRKKAIIICQNS